ncbi:MAG: O-succinylbenzoate synthase [Actinomycetota bacterium]|jgi:O-succinylbenzoate synthase
MRIKSFELHRLEMPLVRPFRTSFGVEFGRDVLLIKVNTDIGIGWGECVSGRDPLYSPEYVDGSIDVLNRYLFPRVLAVGDIDAEEVAGVLEPIRGYPMAKAAVEMALLDAQLRAAGTSWATYFGSTRDIVPSGVSVGIPADDSMDTLISEVSTYVDAGYVRIKLKIQPGWDIDATREVRRLWPDIPLQVDANQAYTRADIKHLSKLDEFNLLLIEQPLREEDILGHAKLVQAINTPVCLDETVVSLETAEQCLDLNACDIINIKPGRVGGYIEAAKIHELCVEREIPVWCGGMLETGIGRAANIAMASLPGFTVVGDISESNRFYSQDLTAPFILDNGQMHVPQGPGLGVDVDETILKSLTKWSQTIDAR